jgi:hypothetical protein
MAKGVSNVSARWMPIGVVAEGQPIDVKGLNPWQCEWKQTADPIVELPHPNYPAQQHTMNVYEITDGNSTVRFAAAELSPNVYGFYVLC